MIPAECSFLPTTNQPNPVPVHASPCRHAGTKKLDVSIDILVSLWYISHMNSGNTTSREICAIVCATQSLQEDLVTITRNAADTKFEGETNWPYAMGRLIGSTNLLKHRIDTLASTTETLEKLRQVIDIFGLDDPKVLDRIIALKSTDLYSLQDSIADTLDEYDLREDPKPDDEEINEDEEDHQ